MDIIAEIRRRHLVSGESISALPFGIQLRRDFGDRGQSLIAGKNRKFARKPHQYLDGIPVGVKRKNKGTGIKHKNYWFGRNTAARSNSARWVSPLRDKFFRQVIRINPQPCLADRPIRSV